VVKVRLDISRCQVGRPNYSATLLPSASVLPTKVRLGYDCLTTALQLLYGYVLTVLQSTIRTKMGTGTFTYNSLRTKTLKERIAGNTKENCKSLKLDNSNAVSVGTTAIKPYLYICQVGLVWFARHWGKMYSRHLFAYGGLSLK